MKKMNAFLISLGTWRKCPSEQLLTVWFYEARKQNEGREFGNKGYNMFLFI
jgi:hypothetical protein